MNSTSLTPLEVAELLKITKNTVYELIKRGELPAYKVGRKLRIDKEDIDNYIKSQKSSTISSPDTQQQEITLNDIPSEKNETKLDDKSIIICGQDMILDILSRNIESSLPSIKSYRSYMGSYNGLYNLYIFFNKVDFPDPLGPIIPTKLPLGTLKDISFKISFLSMLNLKFFT